MIETSGVRRSWLTEDNSAARRRSVSERTRLSSMSAVSRARSMAIVTWSARASSTRRSSASSRRPSLKDTPRMACGTLRRLQRQEQPGGRGERRRTPAGRFATLPRPRAAPQSRASIGPRAGSRRRWRALRPLPARAPATALERRGDVMEGRPDDVVEGPGGGDLAAEGVEIGCPAGKVRWPPGTGAARRGCR